MPSDVVDVAVNLHGTGPENRSRLDALRPNHRIGHGYRGPRIEWQGPPWVEDMPERSRWPRLLHWHGIQAEPCDLRLLPPRVATARPGVANVHPGAAYGSRLWPTPRFAAVAAASAGAGRDVAITGSQQERARALAVAERVGLPTSAVLAGTLSLEAMAALVADACVVVSVDTGAAHLASAYFGRRW